MPEKIQLMYITHDLVDIAIIDQQFAQLGVNKFIPQLFHAGVQLHSFDFFPRNQAFPHFYLVQREGGFKKIRVQSWLIVIKFPGLLKKMVDVGA